MSQALQRGTYPADWRELSAAVKREAGGRCVRCGHPHDAASGHVLTVHHFDGDRDNNARWNLMALCQRCHLSVQSRVDPANPIIFDPAVWAMPYIAGLYEAGGCTPPPGYDLGRWIVEYAREVGDWPEWAPLPKGGKDAAKEG